MFGAGLLPRQSGVLIHDQIAFTKFDFFVDVGKALAFFIPLRIIEFPVLEHFVNIFEGRQLPCTKSGNRHFFRAG
jgi:hypothetical protein